MIKAIIKIRLKHSYKVVAHISKVFEIPNVLGGDGLECDVQLTSAVSIKEIFKPDSLNVETNVVTVTKDYGTDISKSVPRENLNTFVLELETNGWSVDAQQSTIDEINKPQTPQFAIKKEEIDKEKPSLKEHLYSVIFYSITLLIFLYLFSRENLTVSTFASVIIIYSILSGVVYYISLRKYKKSKNLLIP
jgi:hypothetical protein